VSTIVHSTDAIPLAVERTMSWDSAGYGGSGGTAITPNTLWLFGEGSQVYFDTYLVNRSFGMEVGAGAATPITAERAMYFPHSGGRLWEGGHEAAGVNSTSTR
jgi:hypothetical protein